MFDTLAEKAAPLLIEGISSKLTQHCSLTLNLLIHTYEIKQNNGQVVGLACAQGAQAQSPKECMYAHRKITTWALSTQGRVDGVYAYNFKATSLQKLISSKAIENWFRWFSSLLVLLAAWHLCPHIVYNDCYAKMHLLQKHWQVINNNVQKNWSFFSRHVLIQEMP